MIELDFGRKNDLPLRREFYHSPDFYRVELVYIPEEGELPVFGPGTIRTEKYGFSFHYTFSNYKGVLSREPVIGKIKNRSTVVIKGPPHQEHDEEETELCLLWIKERNEWVVILHNMWKRDWAVSDDDHYFGPFALNDECCRKILQAYGVPENKRVIFLDHIKNMSPNELKSLRREVEWKETDFYWIRYNSRVHHEPYAEYGVDWNWKTPGQWALTIKLHPFGAPWEDNGKLDEEAYRVLLEHFGLEDWPDEFPIERIASMSPKELANERRKKEQEFGLPKKEIWQF